METKEKAKELVDKFYPRATSYSLDGKNQNENAKQCALIAVDEILREITDEDDISWFKRVKQEIQAL
jgi:hypothetical protein